MYPGSERPTLWTSHCLHYPPLHILLLELKKHLEVTSVVISMCGDAHSWLQRVQMPAERKRLVLATQVITIKLTLPPISPTVCVIWFCRICRSSVERPTPVQSGMVSIASPAKSSARGGCCPILNRYSPFFWVSRTASWSRATSWSAGFEESNNVYQDIDQRRNPILEKVLTSIRSSTSCKLRCSETWKMVSKASGTSSLVFPFAGFPSFSLSSKTCVRCFKTSRVWISSISFWNDRSVVMLYVGCSNQLYRSVTAFKYFGQWTRWLECDQWSCEFDCRPKSKWYTSSCKRYFSGIRVFE